MVTIGRILLFCEASAKVRGYFLKREMPLSKMELQVSTHSSAEVLGTTSISADQSCLATHAVTSSFSSIIAQGAGHRQGKSRKYWKSGEDGSIIN